MPEISEQDLELFETYKSMGDPQTITEVLQERDKMKRTNAVTFAADLLGYKANVLERLAKDNDIIVQDNKAYIKDGEEEFELSKYAEEKWGDFLPSLKAEQPKTSEGVSYIPQTAMAREARGKNGKKAAVNYIMQKYGWVLGNDSVK